MSCASPFGGLVQSKRHEGQDYLIYFVAIKIIHGVSSGDSASTEILVLTSRYYCICFDISLQAFSYLEQLPFMFFSFPTRF